MKKWIIGLACLGMVVTAACGALDTAATLPVEYAGESGWSTADLEALDGWGPTGLSSPYSNSAKFNGEGDNIVIYFDSSPGEIIYDIRRSSSSALAGPYSATVQESVDNSTWTDVQTYDGSELDGTLKRFTNTLSSSSRYVKFEYVTKPTGQNFGLGYVNIASGGPAVFAVDFDLSDDFIVDEGVEEVLTATAANGTEPYTYSWSSTMAASNYTTLSNVFTILDTAPTGTFSATVEATDASPTTVSNTISFSVQAPAPKYAITITPATNGTVTTTPATEAEEGQTVTINAIPDGGYAVDTTTVLDSTGGVVSVSGGEFTMPALAVTVTVTFQVHTGSALYITEVADPGDAYGGRFVELYNSGGSSIDLAAGSWNLSMQRNGGTTWYETELTGTVAAGSTYVVAGYTNFPDLYPSAPAGTPEQTGSASQGNGDDGYFLYSGGDHTAGTMEDAYGVLDQDGSGQGWEYTDARAVRNTSSTAGNPTWSAGDWTITDPADVADMTPGVYPDGPVVFSVSFDKVEGFTVDEGTSDAITATAANGVEPYTYAWSSTLAASNYTVLSNVFTILANVSTGTYSATVEASDASPATVTNIINFTVVPPPVKYAITITTPTNGAVTTTPPTEAAESETVTVNAVASNGYRTATINVSGIGDLSGTTFTMPAGPVTVTVTFEVYVAPDAMVDFEDYTGSYASNDYVAAGVTWMMTNAYAGGTPDDAKIDTKAGRFQHNRAGADTPAIMRSSAFAQPINKINFFYANFGVNDGGAFKVQVSDDGASWQDVGLVYDPDSTTLVEAVIDVIPANMTYVQIITTAGSAQRVNIDNVGFFFGAASFGVSFDKANGFVVDEGTSDAVTATAANGVPTYSYSWSSDLDGAYYTAASNLFTIQDTAPVGSYYAEVVATDSDTPAASVTNTITFNVVTPGVTNTITITPPINGTVTTTPADEAESGATVTINATPASSNFVVGAITVVDGATNPVAVVGTDFVMPDSAVTVTVLFDLVPTGAELVITGSRTGDVNALMELTITVTNGTATDWNIQLTDPNGIPDYSADFSAFPPTWRLTPTNVGDYALSVTALDGATPIASSNVTLTITTPSANPPILPITVVPGTGFTFEVPAGFTLVRVEGAVTVLSGDVYDWLTLTEGAGNDYTLVGTTITILDSATLPSGYGRMVRIVVDSP